MRTKTLFLILLLVLLVFCLTTLYQKQTSAASYSNDLVRYVAKLKNKIPNRYTSPASSQIAILRQAVWQIFQGEFAGAVIHANAIGYTLTAFTHIFTDGTTSVYYILESQNAKLRPWGTYIIYPWSDAIDSVIEIPHPVSEKNTANIGIKLFIDTKARAFLLSGSRRSKCDVAYTAGTVFQGIHEEVSSETTDVIQIHSFKIYTYPQIVVTSGSPVIQSRIDKFVMELMELFEVGIFNGVQYAKLASINNQQADYTNSIGGNFIGLFLNRAVGHSKRLRSSFISLTETAISETTTIETPLI